MPGACDPAVNTRGVIIWCHQTQDAGGTGLITITADHNDGSLFLYYQANLQLIVLYCHKVLKCCTKENDMNRMDKIST